MAYEILSESYGRRLPKIAAEADSADDLATLGTNWAEGSTCVIGDKTYSLDKVQGWVEPGSGGGGLPDVTADDNGDVLTVVNGAWGKAAPSGGGGVLAISATYDSDTEMMTLDKTFGEISAAFVAGQMYFVHVPETAGTIFAGYYAVTSLWIYSDDSGTVSMLYNDNGTPLYINFDANAADEYPSKYLGE